MMASDSQQQPHLLARSCKASNIRLFGSVARREGGIGEITRVRLDKSVMVGEPAIEWRAVADFRKFHIHGYDRVTMDEVWNTISTDLLPLRLAVLRIIARLEEGTDESQR